MRLIFALIISLWVVPMWSWAQKNTQLEVKFGKLRAEDEEMKVYEKDPDAPAVKLFDIGRSSCTFDRGKGFVQQFERHVRIKIFKKEAYDLATVSFLYHDEMRVTSIKAVSYNFEDGQWKETKLKNENIFDEKLTNKLRLKKIVIPNVREGSIVEYTYTTLEESITRLHDWEFQSSVPTIWSEYDVEIPQFLVFYKMYQGEGVFEVNEEKIEKKKLDVGTQTASSTVNHYFYDVTHLRLVQKDVAANKFEKFMYSPKDNLSRIRFQIKSMYEIEAFQTQGSNFDIRNVRPIEMRNTWTKLGAGIHQYLSENILKENESLTKQAQVLVEGKTSVKEKVQAIYDYLSQTFQSYSTYYLTIPESFQVSNVTHKASTVELNLMMVYMLKAVGIAANPVMISTRDNGVLHPNLPSAAYFDHILTYVLLEDNTYLLVDASAPEYPLGLLPEQDINYDGMLVAKDSIQWVPLSNKVSNKTQINFTFTLDEVEGLSGMGLFSFSGYDALRFRKWWKEDKKEKISSHFLKNIFAEGSLDEIKADKVGVFSEPQLSGSLKLKTRYMVQVANDKIYFNPTLQLGVVENPLKNDNREREIYLGYPRDENYAFTYKIPENYTVEELPKSAKMVFGDKVITFDYIVEKKGNTVVINTKMSIKQPLVFKDDFKALQGFYAEMAAKMQEQIVLSKVQ